MQTDIYIYIYLFIYLFIISRSVLLRMRNFADKSCTENRNTHFVFYVHTMHLYCLLFTISNKHILRPITVSEDRAVYESMWENTVDPGRQQMTVWRMRIACWVTKSTNSPSEYVIIIAFPLQQLLGERTSILRYT